MRLSQVLGFLGGLLSGAIVGAAVVILLAPQSGTETRQRITDKIHEIIDAGKQAMADKRQQLQGEYSAAIQIPLPTTELESD
jgi:gas vesicle protein